MGSQRQNEKLKLSVYLICTPMFYWGLEPGMYNLASKLGHIGPNRDKSGTFQYILARPNLTSMDGIVRFSV